MEKNRDPIKIFKKRVIESGLLESNQLNAIEEKTRKEVDQAVKDSKEADFPTEKDLLNGPSKIALCLFKLNGMEKYIIKDLLV